MIVVIFQKYSTIMNWWEQNYFNTQTIFLFYFIFYIFILYFYYFIFLGVEWSWDAEASTAHPGNFQVLVQALNGVRDNMDRCQKIPVSSLKSISLRYFFFLCYILFMHLIFLFDFFIVDFFHDFVENINFLSHTIFSHPWHVFVCLILY